MGLKGAIKYYLLGKSIKEVEVDRILGKVSNGKSLSKKEEGFLNLYNQTTNELHMDFMYLSKNTTCDKLSLLLRNSKSVICDLKDRDGKIGLRILSVDNMYEEDSILHLDGMDFKMKDRYLYNILYDTRRDKYSLQEQGEYFEKITISND